MMLESFVIYIARDMVEKHGKHILLSENFPYGIIAQALIKMDSSQGKPVKSYMEYLNKVNTHPDLTYMLNKIKYLHENLNIKRFDTELSLVQKRGIIKNSISLFNTFLKDLKDNYGYQKLIDEIEEGILKAKEEGKRSKESDRNKIGNYILENLEAKIAIDDDLETISKSMESIDMNFFIEYNNLKVYPIVVDLLIDTVAIEFAMFKNKKLVAKIHQAWDEAVLAQEEENFFSHAAFTKMELLKKITQNNIRRYLLSEYERVLIVDKSKLRTFTQHILYYIQADHKNTPLLEFDIINEIETRPFLLEKTKIVIGGI
ncbi:hypothetical protein ACLHDG_14340 [Sulfurovum sp. CS9]|uniref:hypothetical protein n=1 Tax=Sulfurovum sp. CS9 TaxID=3391146 RepID=UPI0039EAE6F5